MGGAVGSYGALDPTTPTTHLHCSDYHHQLDLLLLKCIVAPALRFSSFCLFRLYCCTLVVLFISALFLPSFSVYAYLYIFFQTLVLFGFYCCTLTVLCYL